VLGCRKEEGPIPGEHRPPTLWGSRGSSEHGCRGRTRPRARLFVLRFRKRTCTVPHRTRALRTLPALPPVREMSKYFYFSQNTFIIRIGKGWGGIFFFLKKIMNTPKSTLGFEQRLGTGRKMNPGASRGLDPCASLGASLGCRVP